MIEVDAMGKTCPMPVIMAKKALQENTNGENILIRVDNEVATQNLARMAATLNIKTTIEKVGAAAYTVLYNLEGTDVCAIIADSAAPLHHEHEYVVAINSDKMGTGDEGFGKKLLENFVYALTEQDVLPSIVLLYNSGITLSTENEKTIHDLRILQEKGTEILSCGLCLDFYGLKEHLQVGSATNMYRIVEIMRTSQVIRP